MSDIFIKIPAFSKVYYFGKLAFNPMEEVNRELQIMMDRFRTGDGSGLSQVNATNSCVQDSNQAMYIAVMKMLDTIAKPEDIRANMSLKVGTQFIGVESRPKLSRP